MVKYTHNYAISKHCGQETKPDTSYEAMSIEVCKHLGGVCNTVIFYIHITPSI